MKNNIFIAYIFIIIQFICIGYLFGCQQKNNVEFIQIYKGMDVIFDAVERIDGTKQLTTPSPIKRVKN